ncbi:glycoprotein Xg isoform X2 [Mesocricetus auratus]|uniref:Glycoprotein Xg isoform X2 n=1 Tax=Mesocricetus auratus TaxID=10036 RepID=A0ABM2WPT8_MESAU|nr:glycoprotein Xg isoform X2 [Mesocricetus auratus]
MATPWASVVLALSLLGAARGDDGDFDLADALDDAEPTSNPSGGGLYPRLPEDPKLPDPPSGNVYPPPRPRPPPPRPRPHPGDSNNIDGFVAGSGGHGDPQGGATPSDDNYDSAPV